MNSIKNTLLLINGNIDNSSEYNSKQIGDQSGNYWVNSNEEVKYSDDILNSETSGFHKSMLFNENSDCAMIDNNHLCNFSDREFSIDAWVKFDKNYTNTNKKHIIISKWDGTNSVDDDKVFRFYYKQNTNESSHKYYEEVYISFSSTDVLINGNSADNFEFKTGRSYHITFSAEYVKNQIGVPETIRFSSQYILENSSFDYNLDLAESEYEEIDNLEDLLISSSEDVPLPEFKDFEEDILVEDTETENYESYLERRYGILATSIVEVENGILLNLTEFNDNSHDIEIEITNISKIGNADSYDEGASDDDNITSLISTKKQILYNRNRIEPSGKLVFEYNGIKGYESENRKIYIDTDFVYNGKVYEASDENIFYPSSFDLLKFDQEQLKKINPDIKKRLTKTKSKVWKSKVGLLLYPVFYDYEEFYASRVSLNVKSEEDTSEQTINKFEYQKYLDKEVDQTFHFIPIESYDSDTHDVKFSEFRDEPISELNRTSQDYVEIVKSESFKSEDVVNVTFDYSFTGEKEIIINLFEKTSEKEYKWKENIRLSPSELAGVVDSVKDFISDVDETTEKDESYGDSNLELSELSDEINKEYPESASNSIIEGRYIFTHNIKTYNLSKITVFVTEKSKRWESKTASSSYVITTDANFSIDALDVSEYVSSGFKYEIDTENLIDDDWHHFYFGRVGLTSTDEQSGNERIVFGVDGNFTDQNNTYETDENIPYMESKNKDTIRTTKLTSIQPFYEAISGKSPYEKLLKQSFVKIGSDNYSDTGNFIGKLDSIRINEFLTFNSAEELREYFESKKSPECWMYISDSNNYSIYDENTKYNLSGRTGAFGVDLIDVIRYTDTPQNKFEALKHEMGSIPYIKKFVDPEFEQLSKDEQNELINKWRWQLKFIIPVNESLKTKKDVESQLNYANEYLEKEILNG